MIRDAYLTFATNQRPVATTGALTLPYTLPGGLGNSKSLDLLAAKDLGRGNTLVARFEIATTFTGDVANQANFFVAVADDEALTVGVTMLARSAPVSTAGLVVGAFWELAIPELPSILLLGVKGHRYIGLGMEILAPATDFTAGGVNAYILPSTQGEDVHYPSGFSL